LPPPPGTRNLSAAVYEGLRQAISDGAVPPGYHLREAWISRHYGVSSTPVREALRRLEREGLVTIRPNRGAVVQAFDVQGAINLYELRELLEAAAIRHAAQAPAPDLSRAEALLAQMRPAAARRPARPGLRTAGATAAATGDGTLSSWQLDVEFHRALHDVGPNPLLAELAERTHRQIQAVRARADLIAQTSRPAQTVQEHEAILDAVRRHDADEAERLVRQHIRSVRDRVLDVLRKLPHP
jgi:DNA-binding GntR family transcriptional regulator